MTVIKEVQLIGRVSGVNIDDEGIYTSFVSIARTELTPQGCILPIRAFNFKLNTAVRITVSAQVEEDRTQ